ncbi:phosphate ABC transporter permease PstA [Coprothermobacter platensis]|uniref:phosphate ABC transporter permease PstA n=1 Tax=Coprothermobacter platensis TaxID=108819 RepID=UPI000366C40F|nr:phosphate ABC transporter permease PstA [Coprothermobacter platensis]
MKKRSDSFWVLLSAICYFSAVVFVIFVAVHLLRLSDGKLSLSFLFTNPDDGMTKGGVFSPLFGSIYLTLWVLVLSAPVGVLAGVYFAEFAPDNPITRILRNAIRTLSGVPAIVFGLFGLAFFVRMMNLGLSLLASALTLSIMNLPVIITTTEEALRLVPNSQKEAAIALGANSWEVWRDVSVKYASSGILSGIFLALSRALGETAPILLTGVVFYQPTVTLNPMHTFMAMPYHIFILATQHSKPTEALPIAAAAGFVLLILVLLARIFAFLYNRRVQRWL